jgi:hypothetical protein
MDREEGYYWVKYRTGYQIAYWGECMLCTGGEYAWYVAGSEDQYNDSDFEHINETRIRFSGS